MDKITLEDLDRPLADPLLPQPATPPDPVVLHSDDPVIRGCVEKVLQEGSTIRINGVLVENPYLQLLCDRLDFLNREAQASTPAPAS